MIGYVRSSLSAGARSSPGGSCHDRLAGPQVQDRGKLDDNNSCCKTMLVWSCLIATARGLRHNASAGGQCAVEPLALISSISSNPTSGGPGPYGR